MNIKKKPSTPLTEKIVAALGCIVVTGTLGFLGYEAVAGDHSPPNIRLEIESVTPTSQGHRVDILAVNEGGKTAAEIQVEGKLTGSAEETAELTFDFLPPHSERRGGLFFTQGSAKDDFILRAKSYREP